MYAIGNNPRSPQPETTAAILTAIVNSGIVAGNVLVTFAGKTAYLEREELARYLPDTVNVIGSRKDSKDVILDAIMREYGSKEYPVIADGRHRAVAYLAARAHYALTADWPCIEIAEEEAEATSHTANLASLVIAKLRAKETLEAVVALVNAGVYRKEKDIPALRGRQQLLFRQAKLVKLGFPVEKVSKLDKEACQRVLKSPNKRDTFDKELTVKERGNAVKCVSRKEIERVRAALDKGGVDSADPRDILDAILGGDAVDLDLACGFDAGQDSAEGDD
jgi:hypothetical protein